MSTNVSLTPALEKFTRECVKNGRYNNVSEVVRDALRLLQERETRIRDFKKSLDEAMEEYDRVGGVTVEEATNRIRRKLNLPEK